MIRIVRERVDAAALLESVRTDDSGGLALFVGTVRAEAVGGRTLVALEYEAFEPMAGVQMEKIAAEIRRRWPVRGLAMVHRIGRLGIGEASVAVAVACGHRAEAFEACRFGIDEIKRLVPIWKKEHFADGESQWVLPPQAPAPTHP